MNIVYTNLQEDDLGVKRSVRHFQVDFGRRRADREPGILEQRLDDEAKRRRDRLPSQTLSSANRENAGCLGHSMKQWKVQYRCESPANPESVPLRLMQNAGNLAGFYIRRFIETQLRTSGWTETGNTIDILV